MLVMKSELTTAVRAVAETAMRWNFRVWGFGEAIALRGLLAAGDGLGDQRPEAFVHAILRTWLGRGVARTHEDHVGAGRELLELHRRTGDLQFLEAARKLAALHASFPVGPLGARCHRGDTPGWRHQIWVDCMDVDGPFLASLARSTGESQYFDQAADELLGYARTLQEPSGLMRHGFERDSGCNGELWARGNGWALMGLVDTLILLPRTHLAWHELQQRTEALIDGLERVQHASGLWHTVVTESDTYLESTLAAMAAYAIREGIAHEVLSASRYSGVESAARAAMHSQVSAAGELQLVSDATPVGARSVYATRPYGIFPWGQGPLLLAMSQELR
jgi:unsaturated rhamnogalacturonyl hydrolase